MSTKRPPPDETRGRFDRLLKSGAGGSADGLLKRAADDLLAQRTISIARPASDTGKGEITGHALFLLDSAAKGASVKFIGANPGGLAPWTDALRTGVQTSWPNATATKLVRRGTLHCSAAASTCDLVLDRPDEVRTLDAEP